MIVLVGGERVRHNGADALRIGLAGIIESETNLHKLILQIPVDGLGTAHPNLRALPQKILSQQHRISIGIVAANHSESVEFERLAYFSDF
jgi:hypothetical protein